MRLVFAGTPRFAESALAALLEAGHDVALVLTQPDRPGGRGLRASASPVKQLAAGRGLQVYQPESLRSEAALARLHEADAEAMIVAAYGLILPLAALRAAPRGALNIHASLLPRWRGAAPIQRAILAGDASTGISIMQMDEGLDTGPVLLQRAIPILPQDDGGTLHDKLAALGATMMVEVLGRLGELVPVPQPPQGATYARKVDKAEALIAWAAPAASIERQVRAFCPSPGAATLVEGEPVKIWRARVARLAQAGAPGEVLEVGGDGIFVACGEGSLEVLELQRAGGKRLAAGEFLRGRAVRRGMRLG